jgi:lysophospholipase L1-like esterase
MLSRIFVAVGGLLFGIATIVLFEFLLAALGVADDAPLHDPFAGFSSAVPMFELAEGQDGEAVYRISRARLGPEDPGEHEPQREFERDKPEGQFRVFVIGGSSSQGVPYSTSYAFSHWLERRLDASLPDVEPKVVNAGMSGYASRRIVPIVEEITKYNPDLLLVYMGHNEWAENMYYEHLLKLDPRLFRILEWAYGTRIYALASRVLDLKMFQKAPQLDVEIDDNAIQMFGVFKQRASGQNYPTERELAFRDLLYEHNLRSIARTMKSEGVNVIFMTLSQNFSDWPPPASLHRPDISEQDLLLWQERFQAGTRMAETDCVSALQAYQEALDIDDQFADLHFQIANCYRELGRNREALTHYRLASDLDRVPHGANTRFNDLIRRVAKEEDVILVDTDGALIEESGDGLVGYDLFTDFAHPNVRAHQTIAATLSEAMRNADIPLESESWVEGYQDPPLDEVYRQEPQLEVLELQSRVFVCLLALREECEAETDQLLEMDPENAIAKNVRKKLTNEERR